MTSTVLPDGHETISLRTGSDSRFARFTGLLVCRLLGQDPGTVVAHGVWVMPHDVTTTHPSSILPYIAPLEKGASVGDEIFEIRRLSGLTWDELATVLGVSRRSLHHWANGKPISAANEDHVRRVLAALQRIDRGEAHRNRALLMTPCPDGGLAIDLLQRGDFEDLEHLIQSGPGRILPGSRLSADAAAARRPPSPADLVDARHDDGPVTRGRFMRVERVRPRRRSDQE
jgi:transcriptional regulator with XRE-family HTH domain